MEHEKWHLIRAATTIGIVISRRPVTIWRPMVAISTGLSATVRRFPVATDSLLDHSLGAGWAGGSVTATESVIVSPVVVLLAVDVVSVIIVHLVRSQMKSGRLVVSGSTRFNRENSHHNSHGYQDLPLPSTVVILRPPIDVTCRHSGANSPLNPTSTINWFIYKIFNFFFIGTLLNYL